MNTKQQDPIGQAILDFTKSKKPFDIIVNADMCDDDIIPIETLFRGFDDMPQMEQKAMQLSRGKILDVGACAGPHSRYLKDTGFNVTAIDTSPGAILYLNEIGINAHQVDFFEFNPKEQFDTILMLMNAKFAVWRDLILAIAKKSTARRARTSLEKWNQLRQQTIALQRIRQKIRAKDASALLVRHVLIYLSISIV